ncbi:MAG: transcriptional repressor [Pedosphaera sp.]|nr:transcriptional repressor [Pedosphaera sp.]MSU42820.1 transcriptional repressor [Pedosphaera sp.]
MSKVKSRTVFVPPQRETTPVGEQMATSGLRFTPQRRHVYQVLIGKRDHPTAEEVYLRAKHEMPEISLATVYNCLDVLVRCSLVKQVNLNRAAARFCPNMSQHSHFHCEDCGQIFDIDGESQSRRASTRLPRGFKLHQLEMSMRGLCPHCAAKQ